MSLVDDFLNSGGDTVDSTFGTVTMVCGGQTFSVVYNDDRKSYAGALGGLESDIQATVMAQAADVTNPRTLLQKKCTVDGVAYRVAEVSTGAVAISFTLADASESR
jgi:hypothetical protein